MEGITVLFFMMICIFLPSIFAMVEMYSSKEVQIRYVYVDRPINKKSTVSKKPTQMKKVEVEIQNAMQLDAINCLVSLGMKQKDANNKVNTMFQNKKYETIESFLLDAYKI